MREKNSPFPRLPPLNALRVFEAAARHGSFVRAADELHVTHGAVSRQIRLLEEQLGVPLFERRNRAVFLTRQGTELFTVCADAMAQLAQAIDRLRAPPAQAPLVLSCEPTIAMRWLIPRLPGFSARFPAQQLHLLTAGGPVDFARDRVDVALRRNDFPWHPGWHAERVAPELMGPVCHPSAAADWLTSGRPVKMLHTRTRPTAWPHWQASSGHALQAGQPLAGEYFEHFYLCLQAAAAGLGAAVGSAYMVEDDVRGGRLAAPLGFTHDGSEYVLLSPTPFAGDARRMLFLDWLRYEMGLTRERLGL